MIKYYLHDGEKQLGGFEKAELKNYEIKKNTPIWHEALDEWTTAGEIEDLKNIIVKEPPKLKHYNTRKNSKKQSFYNKNKYYLFALVGIIIVILLITLMKTNHSSSLKNRNDNTSVLNNLSKDDSSNQKVNKNEELLSSNNNKSIDEIKKDLIKSEQNTPLKFISINANDKPNKIRTRHGTFFRSSKYEIDGVLIEGFIYSNATLAVFKDIVYKVNYVSDTGTVISSQEFTVYDFLYPSSSIEFKQKVYPPNGTSSINYLVIRASFN